MKAIYIKSHEVANCAFCGREITDDFAYEHSYGLLCEDCEYDL